MTGYHFSNKLKQHINYMCGNRTVVVKVIFVFLNKFE